MGDSGSGPSYVGWGIVVVDSPMYVGWGIAVVDPPKYVGWGIVVVDPPKYVGWEACRVVGTRTSGNVPLHLTQPMGGGLVVHTDH